ncbi:calcium-binding protein [Tieghemostelium lacteum]|uniref:Calcium-binding protein n=1 Tax=Tieghemostelium lacteum TaxID=361077 RepID=A0A151ZBN4_TIELA|nr:calcium-binding protein [Tieghemostelium lacteum]|eukprot:KYQ91294.1 calcium-binding protein [Tieghemostelium lacteum]
MSTFEKELNNHVSNFLKLYDANGDGKVTFEEVESSLKKQGSKNPTRVAKSIFKLIDKDGSNEIDVNEIKKHVMKLNQEKLEADIKADLEDFLKMYDSDGDKEVTFDEAYQVYENCGIKNPDRETMALFSIFDKDKSSTISIDEIKKILISKKFLGPQI